MQLLQHGFHPCLMLLCRAELAPAENELVQAAVQSKRDEMDRQIDQLLWSQSESMRSFWEVGLAHLPALARKSGMRGAGQLDTVPGQLFCCIWAV